MLVASDQGVVALLNTALAGRYAIESEIDSGGMATVYRAHDLKHDRTVAVKVLRPDLTQAIGADRFLKEIRTTANLSHPHILPLFDSGEAGGYLHYVMPFVDGESLADRLEREGQLPVEDAIQIAREVADALAYAHDQGVVHRDIKPANILLERGHALLADFGIAQAKAGADETRLTGMGMSLGTPTYMSPEQISGERDVDGRTDQYALACVLYEMLAGHPPFTGTDIRLVMRQHLAAEAPKVTGARASVPTGVAKAIHRGLAKIPADRYRTVSEFEKALAGATLPWLARIPMGRGRVASYAVAVALVVAAGAWLAFASRNSGKSGGATKGGTGWEPSRASVAVAPFNNRTGDPEWDGGYLAQRISRGLSRSDIAAEVLSTERVERALMVAGSSGDPTEVLARELGAGTVITGDISLLGDSLEIQASIQDASKGTLIHATEPIRGPLEERESLIQAIQDRIAGALALYLDPNVSWQETSSPPLNPAAYAEYKEGVRLSLSRETWNQRPDQFLRAWALDSTYLDAGLQAFFYLKEQGRRRERDSVEVILTRFQDRMTRAQRYLFNYTRATGALAYLEEARAASRLYPLEWAYDLGWAALNLNRCNEAVEAFQKLENGEGEYLDGFIWSWPYYFHQYGEALHRLGLYEKELEVVLAGRRRYPNQFDLMFAELRARIGVGQADSIHGLMAQVRRERGPAKIQEAARELLAHGLDGVARQVLEEEVRRFETDSVYAKDPYRRSEILHWLGREQEAYTLAHDVLAADPESLRNVAWVGILAPWVGDTAQAWEIDRRIAESPQEGYPANVRFNFPFVRAQIHASLGDREGAVRLLGDVYPPGDGSRKKFSIQDHITVELFPLRGYEPFEELMRPKG